VHKPLEVTLPDGTQIKSSHKCELDLPQVPEAAREGYILPGMKNHALLSVTKLCKAGCKVHFAKNECIISYNGKEILKGEKNTINGLWYVPIKNGTTTKPTVIIDDTINSVYHTSTIAETIQFLHQCMFSPTVDTFCKAIDNDQLIGMPYITSSLVRKYLPESTATAKGHMNRNRKHTRSTTKMRETPSRPADTEEDMRPEKSKTLNVSYLYELPSQNKMREHCTQIKQVHSLLYHSEATR
jgi:hypothetical protein